MKNKKPDDIENTMEEHDSKKRKISEISSPAAGIYPPTLSSLSYFNPSFNSSSNSSTTPESDQEKEELNQSYSPRSYS